MGKCTSAPQSLSGLAHAACMKTGYISPLSQASDNKDKADVEGRGAPDTLKAGRKNK